MEFWTDGDGLARLAYDLRRPIKDEKITITNTMELYGGRYVRVKLTKRQLRRLTSTPIRSDIENLYGG